MRGREIRRKPNFVNESSKGLILPHNGSLLAIAAVCPFHAHSEIFSRVSRVQLIEGFAKCRCALSKKPRPDEGPRLWDKQPANESCNEPCGENRLYAPRQKQIGRAS